MKKKNIKKPKFSSYLTAALIPALIVAILINLAGYSFVNWEVRESMASFSTPPSNDLLDSVADLYNSYRSTEQEEKFQEDLSHLYANYCWDHNRYYEISSGSDKLISTDISGFLIINKKYYRLTDDPAFREKYLDAFGDFRAGTDEYWRAMISGSTYISFDEGLGAYSILNLIHRFLGLSIPDGIYTPNRIIDIYLDKDKMVFWPGKVEFSDIYLTGTNDNIKTIDFTPADTKGLLHYSWDDVKGDIFMLSIPYSENGLKYDNEYMSSDGNRLTVTNHYYEMPDLFTLFPVQISAVWVLVAAICILFAFFIARSRYFKVKALYDMIEYRRKTSNAMAHDLKTPLAIISAYADNMAEEEDPGKLREYSAKMKANVESANRLLEDILNFSRSESGSITANNEEISLSALISKSIDLHSGIFREHGITIQRSGKDLTLQTDKKILSQAIDNLISNCARHATENTTVNIDIKDKSLLIINSTDLETDDVNELLKPFIKGSSSRGDTGTGLGLSIAQNDLELLGYKLTVSLKDHRFTATVSFN